MTPGRGVDLGCRPTPSVLDAGRAAGGDRRCGRSRSRSGGMGGRCSSRRSLGRGGQIQDQFVQFTEGVIANEDRSPAERACRAIPFSTARRGLTLASGSTAAAPRTCGSSWSPRTSGWRSHSTPTGSPCGSGSTGSGVPRSISSGSGCAITPARPGRARHPARRRPPLHRPRLPGRDARRGRHPAGRLRAGALDAVQPGLRRVVPDRRQRNSLRHGRRTDLGLDPGGMRGRCGCGCFCVADARGPAAGAVPATGFPALLPEWGYGFWKSRDVHEHRDDVLDDYEGFRRYRDPARRDRDRLPVGDAIQHLGVQPPPVPGRRPG